MRGYFIGSPFVPVHCFENLLPFVERDIAQVGGGGADDALAAGGMPNMWRWLRQSLLRRQGHPGHSPASFPSQLKLPLIGERQVLTIFAVDSRRKMENQRKHLCEFCHNKKAENNNNLFLDVKLWSISRIAALFWSVTELDGTDKYRPRRLLLRERYLSEFFCLSQVYLNQAYMLTIAS